MNRDQTAKCSKTRGPSERNPNSSISQCSASVTLLLSLRLSNFVLPDHLRILELDNRTCSLTVPLHSRRSRGLALLHQTIGTCHSSQFLHGLDPEISHPIPLRSNAMQQLSNLAKPTTLQQSRPPNAATRVVCQTWFNISYHPGC